MGQWRNRPQSQDGRLKHVCGRWMAGAICCGCCLFRKTKLSVSVGCVATRSSVLHELTVCISESQDMRLCVCVVCGQQMAGVA